MKKYSLLFIVSLLLWSCVQTPDYSSTPTITFERIQKFTVNDSFLGKKDSVVITLFFTDGEGDLGINPANIKADSTLLKTYKTQFKEDYYNYLLKTFRSKKGAFSDISGSSLVQQNGRFPRLRPDGRTGATDGYLDYSIDIPSSFSPKNDTLRFEIRLRDRAFNTSNVIQTSPVILNTN
jgi:hypothetical protein